MDSIVSNGGVANSDPSASSAPAGDRVSKGGASNFGKIRAQLQQTADSLGIRPPDNLLDRSQSTAVSSVRSAPDSSRVNTSATERTKVEQSLAVSRHYIDRIQIQLKANPSIGSLQKVSGKLTSIENQYHQLDAALRDISADATPTQYLRLQQMANSMNENINVLAKLVDSASSGVKTILQTQM